MGFFDWFSTFYKFPERKTYETTEDFPASFSAEELAAVRIGDYSRIVDLPYTYSKPRAILPWFFNPHEIGIVPRQQNTLDTAREQAKEEGERKIVSEAFGLLYPSMKSCYEDQHHGKMNPNASRACQDFADNGDWSHLILFPYQREGLGEAPPIEQQPDDVAIAEKKLEPTDNWYTDFMRGLKEGYEKEPKDVNVFQESVDKAKEGATSIATGIITPSNYNILIIGGAVLLFILLIRK